MITKLLLIVCICLIIINAEQCLPPPSGLISWWPGDGNAKDIKGQNDGTLKNGATYGTGKVGQAFSFDGVDDLMQAATLDLPVGNSDRTMEMWIKIGWETVQSACFAEYGKPGTSTQVYYLGVWRSRKPFFSQWGDGLTGRVVLEPNKWYHVAATNVENVITLYVNGNAEGTNIEVINTPQNSELVVGKVSQESGGNNQLVDELSIYNRALSAAEIKSIYNAGSAGKCKRPLVDPTQPSNNNNKILPLDIILVIVFGSIFAAFLIGCAVFYLYRHNKNNERIVKVFLHDEEGNPQETFFSSLRPGESAENFRERIALETGNSDVEIQLQDDDSDEVLLTNHTPLSSVLSKIRSIKIRKASKENDIELQNLEEVEFQEIEFDEENDI